MQHPSDDPSEAAGGPRKASPDELTGYLNALGRGQRDAAESLMPHVYAELLAIAESHMRRQRDQHTLQPTELVNEAFLRLFPPDRVSWNDRKHFFALASKVMRQLLVDHARRRDRLKRGEGQPAQSLDQAFTRGSEFPVDLLDLDLALEELSGLNPLQGSVVELRYFGGLEVAEVASVLDISKRTVERHWRAARAWLGLRLEGST